TERHKPVQRPTKNPPPREQAPTGGLGLSIRAGAQDRTLRLLGTNFVSALLIAGAFGVAVYLHDQKSKSDEDEMKRKVAFVSQKAKPKPEPPKPKPKPPPMKKPPPGPKKDVTKLPKPRLKAPDRQVAKTLVAPTEIPKVAQQPPEVV